jgi:hypothetical protein
LVVQSEHAPCLGRDDRAQTKAVVAGGFRIDKTVAGDPHRRLKRVCRRRLA